MLPLEMYDKIGFSMPLQKALKLSYWMHYKIRETTSDNPWGYYSKKGLLLGIKWCHYHQIEGCTAWAMNWAVINGHLEVMRWLHENRTEGCTVRGMNCAAYE